jgi:SAM-dependent methyltransferase
MEHYDDSYFSEIAEGSRSSAEIVVPLVLELVKARSIVDVGCGTGEWLSVFKEKGVEDICGVDGAYVNRNNLKIPQECFMSANLEHPLRLERKFDLIVSLEVAEHIPIKSAETFIHSLTQLGPVVLFSAALPKQGGINHLNEQWPEYWANLFNKRGYVAIDPLRRKIWNNEKVEFYYRQNILMFVAQEQLQNYPRLKKEHDLLDASMLSVVHPVQFLYCLEELEAWKHQAQLRNVPKMLLRILLPHSIYEAIRTVYRRFQ